MLAAALCLKASDSLVKQLLEDVTAIKLSAQAKSENATVRSEVKQLERAAEQNRSRVAAMAARHVPALDDLKALQTQHRLKLIQMERVSTTSNERDEIITYRTVVSGTVGSAIRFLKDLEDRYLVKSEQVTVVPANDDGSQVNLSFTVEVVSQ